MKRLIAALLVISSIALAETFIGLPQQLGPTASPEFRNLNIESNGTNQSIFTIDNTGCTQYGINGEHFVLNYYNVNDKTVLGGPGIYMNGRGTLLSINGIYATAHHSGDEDTSDYQLIPPFWHTGGAVDVGDWSAAMIGCSTDTRKGLVVEAGKKGTVPGSVAFAIGYNDSGSNTSRCTLAIGPTGIIGFGDVIPTSSNDLDEVEEIFPVLLTPSALGLSLTGTWDVSGTTTLNNLTIADTKKLTFGGALVAPSYTNTGGTGNRTSIITMTAANFPDAASGQADRSRLVGSDSDGHTGTNTYWWQGTATAGGYLQFDFGSGAAKLITEAKFYQSGSQSHHTAKWQGLASGSNPASDSFTDIGSSFVVGGSTTQTMTSLSGNTTGYRYYRLTTVSGSVSASPFVYGFEFKITDGGVSDSYMDQTAGTIRTYQNGVNVAKVSSAGLTLPVAGEGLLIKEGTNATMGTLTANGTTAVTVSTTKVTATSRIFLTTQVPGGTVGYPYVFTRIANTSFDVKSQSGDTSTIAWLIVEPAP